MMAEAEKENMTPTEKMQKQYDRLIAARNYHYDNLNKWLMSFYVIIGALFLAFYTLYSKDKSDALVIVVAIVGYVVSLAALLSIKGYYYWEINWIEKLYRFERNELGYKDDKQIYSSIIKKDKHDIPCCPIKSANVSTTKVALFVTFCVAVAWGFIYGMLYFDLEYKPLNILMTIGISALASHILMFAGAWLLQSDLEGLDELPDSADTHKSSHAKAICITVEVLIAIATIFVTRGYIAGKNDSNQEEIIAPADTATIDVLVKEPIKLEIVTTKQ